MSAHKKWLAFALVPVLLLAGACGNNGPAPIDLVPDDANVVGLVDLGRILDDPDVRALYELLPFGGAPKTIDDVLAEAKKEIGLDLSQLAQVIFFADASKDEYVGLMARGSFDRDELFAAFEAASSEPMERTDYRGVQVLAAQGDDSSDFAAAVLDGTVLVLGSPEAVKRVLAVDAGEAERLGGALLGAYEDLGEPWAKVALTVPDNAFDGLGDLSDGFPFGGGLSPDLGFLGGVTIVSVAIDKREGAFTSDVVLEFPTEGAATEAAELIDALVTLVGGLAASVGVEVPQVAEELLDGVSVEAEGTAVTIRSSVTVGQLSDLVNAVEEFASVSDDSSDLAHLTAPAPTRPDERDFGVQLPTLAPIHGPPFFYTTDVTIEGVPVRIPPTSSNHTAQLSPYGFVGDALVPESVVHNMEHGAAVIWYRPGVAGLAERVEQLVRDMGSQCVVAGSYADQSSEVAVTVWGRVLALRLYEPDAVRRFVATFVRTAGPEAGLCRRES